MIRKNVLKSRTQKLFLILFGSSKGVDNNRYSIYVDILTGKFARQFSVIIWPLFIGQFVHSVEGEEVMGFKGVDEVYVF